MHSVLLAGPSGSDPAGRRAVYDAVGRALPGVDIVDVGPCYRPGALLGAARRSVGVVVAGTSLTPCRPRSTTVGRPQAPARDPGSARLVAAMAVVSGAAHRPLAVVGLSTGRLEGRLLRTLSARVARRPDLLLMGDEESARHLAAAGAPLPLRVAADPAWAVLDPPAGPVPAGESVVVVADGRIHPAVEAGLAAGLEGLARAGQRIRLMPWAGSGTGDGAMTWRLARRLRSATSVPVEVEAAPARLQDAVERMSGSRLVVALRYRGLQAAAGAGVPAAGVAVEGRIATLAERLHQTVLQPDELARTLPALADPVIPPAAAPPDLVAAEVDRARTGLDLMRLVLEPAHVGADELNCLPLVPVPWLS